MKKPFKCPFCWNRYGYEHSRNLHIKEDHRALIQHAQKLKDFSDVVQIISPAKDATKSRTQAVQVLPYQNYTIIRTDSTHQSRSIGSSSPDIIYKQVDYDKDYKDVDVKMRPIRVPVIQANPFYTGGK